MTNEEDDHLTQTQRFGRYISQAAREAGYDIDSPRGGGKKALAEDSGMSPASVSRMLAGITIPLPRYFGPLARALRRPLGEVMVESGSADADLLAAAANALSARSLTPEDAAIGLGIKDPMNVQLFIAMVEKLLQSEGRDPKDNHSRGVA